MKSKHEGTFDAQAFLDSAGVARRIVEYRRGDVIFTQGDPCDSVLYIQKGGVKISVLSKTGRQAVVAMLGAGDFFGEGGLAGQPVRMGSATASIAAPSSLWISMRWCASCTSSTRCLIGLSLICWHAPSGSRKTSSTSSSAPARNGWRESCCCSRGTASTTNRAGRPGDLPGDTGGNGRHDAIAREFLYEEIPATGVHRLQRWAQGPPLAAHGRLARLRKRRTSSVARRSRLGAEVETSNHR